MSRLPSQLSRWSRALWPRAVRRLAAAFVCGSIAGITSAQPPALDAGLRERIDNFIESERQASGIPGIALAIVQDGAAVHLRGFGDDGRGHPVGADTPFPIGSLTKSFTALLVRQAIDAGQLDADAPVQRYLPWFRVADGEASARITLRHLLNQTSGFSHADGVAPLVRWSNATIEETARGFATVSLNRPVGERFEYSNLNWVLLGAVLQAATGRSWQAQVQTQIFQPLQMTRSHTDHDAGRQAGMTAVHRLWFGKPVAHRVGLLPGFAPAGSLVSSADDMSRYLAMLLAQGKGPRGRVVSRQGVAQLLAPAAPLRRFKLGPTEFEFRYGEGWLVGPFGAAADARWHQGALAAFEAWMVLLPQTNQAVVLLINAKSDLPINGIDAVTSRLPIGVVNLLRGQPPPQGPSVRQAYLPFNTACAFALVVLTALTVWAARTRRRAWPVVLLGVAIAIGVAGWVYGLNPRVLWAFTPDVGLVVAAALVLLCLPAALSAWAWARRSWPCARQRRP
jgi:CubicO group peptidase (beta-lactamase class C family)